MKRRQLRRTMRRLFGPSSDITWVFHAKAGEPCEACRLNCVHYSTCTCGHCPPDPGVVIHRRLSEVLAEAMPELFADVQRADESESESESESE